MSIDRRGTCTNQHVHDRLVPSPWQRELRIDLLSVCDCIRPNQSWPRINRCEPVRDFPSSEERSRVYEIPSVATHHRQFVVVLVGEPGKRLELIEFDAKKAKEFPNHHLGR